jgi:hypothetical protein
MDTDALARPHRVTETQIPPQNLFFLETGQIVTANAAPLNFPLRRIISGSSVLVGLQDGMFLLKHEPTEMGTNLRKWVLRLC